MHQRGWAPVAGCCARITVGSGGGIKWGAAAMAGYWRTGPERWRRHAGSAFCGRLRRFAAEGGRRRSVEGGGRRPLEGCGGRGGGGGDRRGRGRRRLARGGLRRRPPLGRSGRGVLTTVVVAAWARRRWRGILHERWGKKQRGREAGVRGLADTRQSLDPGDASRAIPRMITTLSHINTNS